MPRFERDRTRRWLLPLLLSSSLLLEMNMAGMAQIPNGTLLLSMFSDADQPITDELAKQIFYGATNVPLADKDYIVVNSDSQD